MADERYTISVSAKELVMLRVAMAEQIDSLNGDLDDLIEDHFDRPIAIARICASIAEYETLRKELTPANG